MLIGPAVLHISPFLLTIYWANERGLTSTHLPIFLVRVAVQQQLYFYPPQTLSTKLLSVGIYPPLPPPSHHNHLSLLHFSYLTRICGRKKRIIFFMEKGETHTAMRNISEKGKCTTYGVSHVAIPTFPLLLSPLHINIQWYMQVYWRSAKSKKKENILSVPTHGEFRKRPHRGRQWKWLPLRRGEIANE